MDVKCICFDMEIIGIDVMQAEMVGMFFVVKFYEVYYVFVLVDYEEVICFVQQFKVVMEDEDIEKVV